MSKYHLIQLIPSIGDSKGEIDLINYEEKIAHIGMWLGVSGLCYRLGIEQEIEEVKNAVEVAFDNGFLSEGEYEFMQDHFVWCQEEYGEV